MCSGRWMVFYASNFQNALGRCDGFSAGCDIPRRGLDTVVLVLRSGDWSIFHASNSLKCDLLKPRLPKWFES